MRHPPGSASIWFLWFRRYVRPTMRHALKSARSRPRVFTRAARLPPRDTAASTASAAAAENRRRRDTPAPCPSRTVTRAFGSISSSNGGTAVGRLGRCCPWRQKPNRREYGLRRRGRPHHRGSRRSSSSRPVLVRSPQGNPRAMEEGPTTERGRSHKMGFGLPAGGVPAPPGLKGNGSVPRCRGRR